MDDNCYWKVQPTTNLREVYYSKKALFYVGYSVLQMLNSMKERC